ncbi:hypothetical protein D3C72_2437850 [compost metagenome]
MTVAHQEVALAQRFEAFLRDQATDQVQQQGDLLPPTLRQPDYVAITHQQRQDPRIDENGIHVRRGKVQHKPSGQQMAFCGFRLKGLL